MAKNFTERELLDEIAKQNPWWRSGKIRLEKTLIERDIFPEVKKEIKSKKVTAVIGLRRTGKTTLLKQTISHLLVKNPPRRIFYFSFDALEQERNIIKEVVRLYFQNILGEVPEESKSNVHIFLDEVQKVNQWGEEIKSIWDKNYPIKFFVSGSSSMNILKGSGESLLGRIKIYQLTPFSFREFLKYRNLETKKIELGDILNYQIKYPENSEKLQLLFKEYLEKGGFPEIYQEDNPKEYVSIITSLSFYRDIINLFPVKRADVLEGIFHHFIRESGQVINYHHLATSLKTKYETIRTYVDHLELSFLIHRSVLFSKSKLKSLRKNPKIYVADHGFSLLEPMDEGLKIETAVYNHLYPSHDVFYWRNDSEVDIILENKKTVPIEVKFKEEIKKEDLRGILKFMKDKKADKAILITKNQLKKEKIDKKEIIHIPAWLFLLAT